jgi:hypothetical protein
MSGLRVLLPISFAVALFGQTEPNAVPNPGAVIDRAVREIGKSSLGLARPMTLGLNQTVRQFGATSRCSVPLREMKIPDDKSFTIIERKPPQDFTDRMAVAPEAPACPSATK